MPNQQADDPVAAWLSTAGPEPGRVRREWAARRVALVPLGDVFVAVRLCGHLVHAALGTAEAAAIAEGLARRLQGPVICDPRPCRPGIYYPLVSPAAGRVCAHGRSAGFLGPGVYLGLPAPDCVRPAGVHWAVTPRHAGDLCRADAVAALVAASAVRLGGRG